jgi:signal peptidase I
MSEAKLESQAPNQPASSRKKWLIDNLISLGTALLLVFTIRSSVIEAFKIPSGSMIPTLMVGDHIFVNKFAYGFKLPFSDWFSDSPITLIERAPPKRGDIIVFLFPRDESLHYIKRVVAIPGDTIEVRDKVIYLNGSPIPHEPLPSQDAEKVLAKLDPNKYSIGSLEAFQEHLDAGNPIVLTDRNNFSTQSFGPETVPAGHVFVMGDNRDFSNDSRFWGFVPFKNIKGKALFVWLSVWFDLTDKEFTFRPERIGTWFK